MIWSAEEIVRSYRMAADPKKQIKVLAELNACSVKEIRQVLVGEGVLRARQRCRRSRKKRRESASMRRPRGCFMRKDWTMRPSRRRQA